PQLLADFADTLAMLNGRNLEGRPLELIGAALKADPKHPKALMLLGTAAFNRGDFAAAAATWQALLAALPPDSEQAKGVAASSAQAQQRAGTPAATAKPPTDAIAGASIDGTVTLSDALKPRVAAGATLFVF